LRRRRRVDEPCELTPFGGDELGGKGIGFARPVDDCGKRRRLFGAGGGDRDLSRGVEHALGQRHPIAVELGHEIRDRQTVRVDRSNRARKKRRGVPVRAHP